MKINIGTTKGNIAGHEINKHFKNITYLDVRAIVDDSTREQAHIIGWCPTNKRTSKKYPF